jgi:aminoglycoside phosphotransferase (APT) family kinase protein
MRTREYSKRLGMLSDNQLQTALERLGLGDFVRAEPIPFGLFGQNLFLTSTKGEFVLRGAPHSDWQFPTEQFFAEQLHQKTQVPVPYPYMLEASTDIFGWSFIIMPRLSGLQTIDPKMTSQLALADRVDIARAMARTLTEAHMLTWDCTGEYNPETNSVQPFEQDYRTWVIKRIRENVAASRNYNNHTTEADVQWVETIITNASHTLEAPYEPCVVLADYGEHNVVVEHTQAGWRVSGVFDLMTARFGDGKADLSGPVAAYLKENPMLADEFVQTYLRHKPVQPGFVERQQLYMLGLYASMWEYWQRDRGGVPEDKTLSLKQWAKPFVAYWAKAGY